ncbi:MAG: 30S ribosomal protein S19 [Bdellovibrionota bacterium]
MARSLKKGPFIANSLQEKIEKARKEGARKSVIKTWSRASLITPDAVGLSFAVHNGKKFIPLYVTENMVGHRFGEFAPTRHFGGHTSGDKKASAS